MSAPVEIGRDEARRRAEEELAKAKYQGTPQWLQDLLDRFGDFIGPLFDLFTLVNPDPRGNSASWALPLVTIVAIVVLVVLVWKFGLPKWRPKVKDAVVDADESSTPDDYRSIADRAAESGDWTVAVRERFRALVRELEERTIIDPRPARTALEAAGLGARMMPHVEPELHQGALLFNDVMYGERIADRAAYDLMVGVDAAVRGAAESFRHPDDEDDQLDDADQNRFATTGPAPGGRQ